MEHMQELLTAISTVGWPIVCTLLMMIGIYKLEATHKEETDKLAEALNNNTKAIIELKARLEEDR